jgi:hypothetical protein
MGRVAENTIRKRAPKPAHPTAAPAPTSNRDSSTTASPSSASGTRPRPAGQGRIPRMTMEERSLLFDNEGCLKCRLPFAGHWSKECPNGFPSRHVPVMQALVDSR